MRVSDYELSNLILRIEQDKNFTPKDSVVNLGALRDLIDARAALVGAREEVDSCGLNLQESGRELAAAYERIEKYETSEAVVWAKYREMEKAHDHEFKSVTKLLHERKEFEVQIAKLQSKLEAEAEHAKDCDRSYQAVEKELEEKELILNDRIEKLTVQLAMAHELALKAARQIEEIK